MYICCLNYNALVHLLLHTLLEFILIASTSTYVGKLSPFDDLPRKEIRKNLKERCLSFKNTVKIYPAECEEDFAPLEIFTFPHVFAELWEKRQYQNRKWNVK